MWKALVKWIHATFWLGRGVHFHHWELHVGLGLVAVLKLCNKSTEMSSWRCLLHCMWDATSAMASLWCCPSH